MHLFIKSFRIITFLSLTTIIALGGVAGCGEDDTSTNNVVADPNDDTTDDNPDDTTDDNPDDTIDDTIDDTTELPPYDTDRPAGQCVTDDDCVGGTECNQDAPGGICMFCYTAEEHCASNHICVDNLAYFGTCNQNCESDSECPSGLHCTSGLCLIELCVDGVCPSPLMTCDTNNQICSRIDCSGDATSCPEGTSCAEGYCVADVTLD